jgi:integrase
VVLIGGEAGLRAGEMPALQSADENVTRRQLRVARSEWHGHLTATKGGRVRHVPLTRRLAAALEAARPGIRKADEVLKRDNGSPFRECHVADLLIKVAREAGMPPNGPHTLRHTFCSHLAMRGAPVGAIQALAGHQDLMTTQRYMHLSPNVLDAAIGLLDTPRDREEPRGDIVETLAGVVTSD